MMESRWDDAAAAALGDDALALRVYTSRLLGAESTLVLHGGGNTSVKVTEKDFFGDDVDILYVKGSGWDLKTIEKPGFAGVRLDVLRRLAERETLTDTDMVLQQRAAMLDPRAPNPSVEAILHAVIPHRFVDHTHADAVVTITNTADGPERIASLYGDRVIVIPYVMPGFILARAVREAIAHLGDETGEDWAGIEGMILLNHGVFTFGDTAREAYERMIALVAEAERYLIDQQAWGKVALRASSKPPPVDALAIARLRRAVSDAAGGPMLATLDQGNIAAGYALRDDVAAISTRGPVTPDHIIRTKRVPLVFTPHDSTPEVQVSAYVEGYRAYFDAHRGSAGRDLTAVDPAPRFAVWPGVGQLSFGRTLRDAHIVADIARHTAQCVQRAEALGGWVALDTDDLFDMEYWELEQAKLARHKQRPPLSGKVAVVTGAAGGIGRACAARLGAHGAAVVGLDIAEAIGEVAVQDGFALGLRCDVTSTDQVQAAVEQAVRTLGGVDIVVSNAGSFPPSTRIADLDDEAWGRSLELNLTSHLRVMRACAPFLAEGIDPAVIIVASKNVPAPGRGVAAYSAAKAGLTQLGRVAALELGEAGVRVNKVHPNAVFDTGIWDEATIAARASHYGLTPDAYKRNNVLKIELASGDVAELVCAMVGPAFRGTTGAQIPIDGGNERVI